MTVHAQDIDDILRNRTEKRQLGFSKGNTFSTATFTVVEEPQVGLQKLYLQAFSHAACSRTSQEDVMSLLLLLH